MKDSHFSLPVICMLVLLCVVEIVAQKPAPTPERTSAKVAVPKPEDPNVLRWRIFLDGLVQEARSVSLEERRPYAMADVAAAYWEIDKDESRAMFITALDAAWKLTQPMKPLERRQKPVLDYVRSTAAKTDSELFKALNDRLAKKEGADKEAENLPGGTFYEMLDEDPERAARLLESNAPNGLENGMAVSLIIQLAHRDVGLANRVFNTYLNKVLANDNIPLQAILPLAGYAFGYSESWTMDKRGEGNGSSLEVLVGQTPNPTNTNLYIALAFRRLSRTIEQRNNAPGNDTESLSYPILFAFGYLMPEIERFAPGSLAAWRDLQQQGLIGTTPVQAQRMTAYLMEIVSYRVRMPNYSASPERQEQEAEASLEGVEKLVGTCQRDVVYSKSALTISYRKNFKRANQLAGEIEDTKQRAMVEQVIISGMASSYVNDGEWDEAEKLIKKLTSPGAKGVALAEFAEALVKKNEKARGEKAVDDAAVLAEKLTEPKEKSGLLFGLSSILLKSDPAEARTLLSKAIKSLNKQEPVDKMQFSIPVRVPLGCNGSDRFYWGDESLANATIFEAVPLFAKENPDETNVVVETVADKITRIRLQATMAKIALMNVKKQPVREPR